MLFTFSGYKSIGGMFWLQVNCYKGNGLMVSDNQFFKNKLKDNIWSMCLIIRQIHFICKIGI